jgi:aconitate decarboxylase
MEKNSFKPYPCGIVIHPAIDGCSQLKAEGVRAEDIDSVELRVHPLVLELTGRKHPRDGLGAKFSVYFGAACGLLFGKATPDEYTDEIVEQTKDLRDKTTATIDDSIQPDECRITVQTKSGAQEKHVEHAVGSLAKPMSKQQFQQKFEDQVEPVIGENSSQRLFSSLLDIMQSKDVAHLVRLE